MVTFMGIYVNKWKYIGDLMVILGAALGEIYIDGIAGEKLWS